MLESIWSLVHAVHVSLGYTSIVCVDSVGAGEPYHTVVVADSETGGERGISDLSWKGKKKRNREKIWNGIDHCLHQPWPWRLSILLCEIEVGDLCVYNRGDICLACLSPPSLRLDIQTYRKTAISQLDARWRGWLRPWMLRGFCVMVYQFPASSMKSDLVSCVRQSSDLAAWNVQPSVQYFFQTS